jgi:NADP-dependent 3-hydroxy acid dehydrogenase YdfG
MTDRRTAVVTGASSGIGAAAARQLAKAGWHVILGARRVERLQSVAEGMDAESYSLDVTDQASIDAFIAHVPQAALLVNNAGGALGLEPVAQADDEKWRAMYETNVMGLMRMTRALLPALEASGAGHIVNIGSIAGFEVYPGGAGYTAAKHAARAVTQTLRLELLGKPIRVTEIDPGMVETEFSQVRFDGNMERARKTYQGMTPLTADDIAEAIVWAVSRPGHVNIDAMVIRPLDQATATQVHRRASGE